MSAAPGVPSPAADEPPDRGLQAERTSLAWVRTALVCAGLTAVAVHLASTTTTRAVAAVVGMLVAGAGMAAAWVRVGGLARRPPTVAPRACPALLTVAVVAADALALVLLVAG